MRSPTRLAVLAGALAVAFGLGTPAKADPLVILDKGHVDVVDVEYADGGFELHIHDETQDPGVERDPADVLLRALPKARTTVPADPAYSFLGSPGGAVWILPQTQDPDLLFAGLSTEELEPGVFTGDQVAVTLCSVSGPGRFSVFTTDAVGNPDVVFNSHDGLPDTTALPVGGHQHVNWAFRKAGTYRLTFHVSGRLAATNQLITSAPATVTFEVRHS